MLHFVVEQYGVALLGIAKVDVEKHRLIPDQIKLLRARRDRQYGQSAQSPRGSCELN